MKNKKNEEPMTCLPVAPSCEDDKLHCQEQFWRLLSDVLHQNTQII